MKCSRCGVEMLALLTSVVCPAGCDQIPKGPPCPKCRSSNTERFDISGILDCFAVDDAVRDSLTYHCWPCGEVWNIEPEIPETD